MPVLFLERIPLPSLRTYFTFSMCALLISALRFIYELQDDELLGKLSSFQVMDVPSNWAALSHRVMNDAWCFWSLVNIAYCILISVGAAIEIIVFGQLRIVEQEHIRDKFWNFVFYKFIFVFGVMNVQTLEGVVLWFTWFSALGFLQLHTHLSKDRFDYLVQLCSAAVNRPEKFTTPSGVDRPDVDRTISLQEAGLQARSEFTEASQVSRSQAASTVSGSSCNAARYRREIDKVVALLCCILALLCGLLACSYVISVYESGNQAVFMATECVLQIFTVVYIIVKHMVFVRRLGSTVLQAEQESDASDARYSEPSWGAAARAEYYVDLLFDLLSLAIEIGHHLHMLMWSQIIVSMANLVVCMQLRYLYYELHNRVVRHVAHLRVKRMLTTMRLLVSREPRCAICWERASVLRELPCAHSYHETCIRLWLQQELACPICRASLASRFAEIRLLDYRAVLERLRGRLAALCGPRVPVRLPQLPVRLPAISLPQLLPSNEEQLAYDVFGMHFDNVGDAARYIHSLLPHASVQAIRNDLVRTKSAEQTVERLLDGELSGSAMREPEESAPDFTVHFPCSPMQIALGASSSTLTDFVHMPVCGGGRSRTDFDHDLAGPSGFCERATAEQNECEQPSSSATRVKTLGDSHQVAKLRPSASKYAVRSMEERKAELIRLARSRYIEKHGWH